MNRAKNSCLEKELDLGCWNLSQASRNVRAVIKTDPAVFNKLVNPRELAIQQPLAHLPQNNQDDDLDHIRTASQVCSTWDQVTLHDHTYPVYR